MIDELDELDGELALNWTASERGSTGVRSTYAAAQRSVFRLHGGADTENPSIAVVILEPQFG